jgi:hypothetical protein
MNLVGKIFIVLIFVMSILFMGFVVAVYATHTNWRNLVMTPETGLEAQLKDKELELERLTSQMTKTEQELATEILARQNSLAQAETQKELLAEERDQLVKDYATKNELAREAVASMAATHETLAALRSKVDMLDVEILAAYDVRDDAIISLIAKTDDANIQAVAMQTLQKQAVQTSEQLADAMEVLRKFKLKAAPSTYSGTPPKGVPGIVTAAPQGGLVEISIGGDDGLLVGHRLDVYRSSTYLGKIEVISIKPDKAVCKVLPEFRKGIIQANDRVSTGLQSQ